MYSDYGSRCDVLLSSCNPTLCSAIKENINYLNNCKIIINPTKTYHTNEKYKAEFFVKEATNNSIPFIQLIPLATILAVVVLPIPLIPVNR